jgi:hypothetical protein
VQMYELRVGDGSPMAKQRIASLAAVPI